MELIAWVVEAFLHAQPNGSATIRDVLESPRLFPFRLKQVPAAQLVSLSPRLDLLRHELNDELVMLQK